MSAERYSYQECVQSVKESVLMKKGDYIIYKLISKKGEEVVLFFLPEKNTDEVLRRKTYRILTLQSYKSQGYSVFAVAYVDKETYLNAKLDERVKDYCYADKLQHEFRERRHEVSPDVYFDTIQCCEDNKWTALKQISMIIRRLIREDLDVYNEIGIQLYDQYMKAMA